MSFGYSSLTQIIKTSLPSADSFGDEQGIAFGLCDLGQGFPELGYVDLQSLSKDFGDRLERDLHFRSTEKLSAYVNYARQKRMIITDLPSNYKQ